ncbi:MAG: hypothetical protein GPJ51_04670, partial [Candidatus Heimdallarchaeota archaeon]|nr:hypothetical protein [Candidatus Heimdallarchaeota archaeon]
MSQTDVVQVQPVKLTQKLGRYTKGLMISIAIILLSATLAVIGIQIQEEIITIVGFVIAGLCSIIFLVFLILFLTSIRRLGRTNEKFSANTNKIFVFFLYGLLFGIAGSSNSYSVADYLESAYVLSRVFGIVALVCFGLAFVFINKQFKLFKEEELYKGDGKKKLGSVIILASMIVVILVDTILRPVVYQSLLDKGEDYYWISDNFIIPLNYVTLGIMFVLVAALCYFLYLLGDEWLKIDDDLNEQYFKMGGKTFNDKFKGNILYISTMFLVATFLSLVYVIYYFVNYLTGGWIEDLIFSIGIFVGVIIVLFVIFIIRISLNFNKIAQLNSKTSNYGIFTAIALSFSPFLLIAGFFSGIEFSLRFETHTISRILLILGLVLFAIGSFFNYMILKNLKLNKEGFEVRKKDLILPISGLVLTVILIIDTIVRIALWNNYGGSDYAALASFNLEYLWLGYLFGALFFIAIIPTIYGIITTSKEYLKVIPAYGKIPLRLKKSKLEEQLQLYQTEQEMVPAAKAVAYE